MLLPQYPFAWPGFIFFKFSILFLPLTSGMGNEGRRGKRGVWKSKEGVQREWQDAHLHFQEVRVSSRDPFLFTRGLKCATLSLHGRLVREIKKSASKKEEKRKSAGGDKDKERGGGNDSFKSREFIETSEESSSDSDHKSKSKKKKKKKVMIVRLQQKPSFVLGKRSSQAGRNCPDYVLIRFFVN